MKLLPILQLVQEPTQNGPVLMHQPGGTGVHHMGRLVYLSMTRPRAAIVVDNVVRTGKIISAAEAEKAGRVLGTRQLIEAIGKDGRVDATVTQTVGKKGYDGFLLAIEK